MRTILKRVGILCGVVIVIFALVGLYVATQRADHTEAESYLGAFTGKFFPGATVVASECQNVDSDGDGYVSCTLSIKEPNAADPTKVGAPQLIGVECAASWPWQFRWFMTGCRLPKTHANGV